MKHILILGGNGHLGKILINVCLERNSKVTALVRNPKKLNVDHTNLKVLRGNVTDTHDLKNALINVDIVISVLGHGFRTSYPIQEKTMAELIPIMEKKKIIRFIAVTGAGLKINGDPHSFVADISEIIFNIVDPYRMKDAKNQQILLEKSDLDWTVVRTPIHNNMDIVDLRHMGFTQPKPWQTISRKTVCEFIIRCIEKNEFIKKAPIIY